jgi:stage II sporulation protein D
MFEHVSEYSVAHRAAAETRGIVLAYGSRVLMTFFHSASGGRTADCNSVYDCPSLLPLSSVKLPVSEDSPYDDWEFEMTLPAFVAAAGLPKSAAVKSFRIERTPDLTVSSVTCVLSDGQQSITGRQLRDKIGTANVRSLWYDVALSGSMVRFNGKGFGHRVGMSQWGARALAQRGDDASTILTLFYPGSRPMRLYK